MKSFFLVLTFLLSIVQLRSQDEVVESYFLNRENNKVKELSKIIHPTSLYHYRLLLKEASEAVRASYAKYDDEKFENLEILLSDQTVSDAEIFRWTISNMIDSKSLAPGFKPEIIGKIDSLKDGRVFFVVDSPLIESETQNEPGRGTFLITVLQDGEEFKIFDISDFTEGILNSLKFGVERWIQAEGEVRKAEGVSPGNKEIKMPGIQ